MKTLALSLVGAALCFVGVGCAAKGSIRTGHNAGAGAAVHVGHTTAMAPKQVATGGDCCGGGEACCPGACCATAAAPRK